MDGSYLARKYREMDYDKHVRALSNMKSSIDSSAPRSFSHITKGGKKAALAEGKIDVAGKVFVVRRRESPLYTHVRVQAQGRHYRLIVQPQLPLQSVSCILSGKT